jgi:preprotein translocase subunit SecE
MDRSPADGLSARVVTFLREVRSELARVVWPTRRELVVQTIVVLATVVVLMSLVASMDELFTWLIVRVFEGSS